MREQVAQTVGAPEELTWGVKQQAWEAIVIRVVRESVTSARRGM